MRDSIIYMFHQQNTITIDLYQLHMLNPTRHRYEQPVSPQKCLVLKMKKKKNMYISTRTDHEDEKLTIIHDS